MGLQYFSDSIALVNQPVHLSEEFDGHKQGTLIKRAGVRTPWTPTLDPPLLV